MAALINESVENLNWFLRLSRHANRIYTERHDDPHIKGLFDTASYMEALLEEFNVIVADEGMVERQLSQVPFIRDVGDGLWSVTRDELLTYDECYVY